MPFSSSADVPSCVSCPFTSSHKLPVGVSTPLHHSTPKSGLCKAEIPLHFWEWKAPPATLPHPLPQATKEPVAFLMVGKHESQHRAPTISSHLPLSCHILSLVDFLPFSPSMTTPHASPSTCKPSALRTPEAGMQLLHTPLSSLACLS